MFKRTEYENIWNHLKQPEITLITGPRQAGKTTLIKHIEQQLKKEGNKTLFLSLDSEADQKLFASQETLLSRIRLEHSNNKAYIFIDELQRKQNAGIFLKGIYDMDLPYKFIVTGSGNLDIKADIPESLAGRKRMFYIFPLSFDEFVDYKTEYAYSDRLHDLYALKAEQTLLLLQEYLLFGGYPRVVLAETFAEKYEVMQEIYASYRDKDIQQLLEMKQLSAFSRMVEIISAEIGQQTSISSLADSSGMDRRTLENALTFCERTFFIHQLRPYFTNKRKELAKSPTLYFQDVGMRNFAFGTYGSTTSPTHNGFVFENFIFTKLYAFTRKTHLGLYFWRTQNKAEVDFVIKDGQHLIPIEVKYSLNHKHPKITRSLHSFINHYDPKTALIVNKDFSGELQVKNTIVKFVRSWELEKYMK